MEFQNYLNGLLRIVTRLPSMKVRSAIVTLVHCSHVIHMSAEHLYLWWICSDDVIYDVSCQTNPSNLTSWCIGWTAQLLLYTWKKCRKVKTNVHKITRILGIFSNDLITMFAPPPPTPPRCHTPRCCNRRTHPGPSSTCTAWFGSTCPRNWKSGIVKSRSLYI